MHQVGSLLVLVVAVCSIPPPPAFNCSTAVTKRAWREVLETAPVPPKTRIINGTSAGVGQFPYQAAIGMSSSFCGGSLISKNTVLTAAHCVVDSSTFSVGLGVVQLNGATWHVSRRKIVHGGYNDRDLSNDVALIVLSEMVHFTDVIQPIALASDSSLYVGKTARVSGWGRTRDSMIGVSSQLYYADLTVISNEQCMETYGILPSSVLCTTGRGQSTCNGDSGGPLVFEGKLIGVVSFGAISGCEKGYPNGFSRVTSFKSWIDKNFAIKPSSSMAVIVGCYLFAIVLTKN